MKIHVRQHFQRGFWLVVAVLPANQRPGLIFDAPVPLLHIRMIDIGADGFLSDDIE